MADALAFHYRARKSWLHRFDPRLKSIALLLASPAIMIAGPVGLCCFSAALIAAGWQAGLKWRVAIYDLRYFGLLLLMVWGSRAVFTPGGAILTIGPIKVTTAGTFLGGLICWRLVLVVAAGLIYAATTQPKKIRAAVQSLLAPLPGFSGKKVGVMIGLLVRFIPLILDEIREINAIQKARCIDCRKNPLYRLTHFSLPILRKIIKRADHLVAAMTARCYNENPTPPPMQLYARDWFIFIEIIGLCLLAGFMPEIF